MAGRLAVAREEVEEDDVVGGDRARPAVVPDRGLGAVGDDELVCGGAVLAEHALDLELDPLAGQRLAAQREHAVRARRGPQQRDAGGYSLLDRAARAADARQLGLGLDAPTLVEEALVGLELDPVRAQVVRVAEREGRGRDGALDAEVPAGVEVELPLVRVRIEAAPEQLVDADVLERQHFEAGAELRDPAGLERADDDGAFSGDLRIEERIGDGERHLVPELRRADRVRDDQHVGHRRDPRGSMRSGGGASSTSSLWSVGSGA